MINLPPSTKKLISLIKIPRDLRKRPDHPLVEVIVLMTANYRELINEFDDPQTWGKFKRFVSQKTSDFKIDNYIDFYERPNNLFFALSNSANTTYVKDDLIELAKEGGFEDIVFEKIENVDEKRLTELLNHVFRKLVDWFKDLDAKDSGQNHEEDNIDWRSSLSEEQQIELIKAFQYMACHILICFYNALSIMTNRQSMFTLIKKALSGEEYSDEAMCLAVRIDNSLRQHPKFLERYKKATINSDQVFLSKYHLTSSPITHKIKYPGVYFLLSILNSFGALGSLTNNQVLCLCEHAGLNVSECDSLDTKGMAKIRKEFLMLNSL